MVAPYESDAQLAHLFHTGQTDYVLSEDSDMFAHGVFKLIKGLKNNGQCLSLDLSSRKSATPIVSQLRQLSRLNRRFGPDQSVRDVRLRLLGER